MKQTTTDTSVISKELIEKAEIVSRRMTELHENMDQTAFRGQSDDGIVEIELFGDGRPSSVELHLDIDDEVKQRFAYDILEALENVFIARITSFETGLQNIQQESGLGPDFKMPF